MKLEGIYCEGRPVEITKSSNGRLVILAYNEGGHNSTEVDLLEFMAWVKKNMPELME